MKHGKIILLIAALLFIPLMLSCSGGGSSGGASTPPTGNTDPADIVASVRYQIANVSYSQSATVIAKVFDSNGDRVPDGTAVRFSLNDIDLTNAAKELAQVGPVFSNGQSVYDTVTANGFASAIVSYQGVITSPCVLAQVTIRPTGFIQVYENIDILFYSNASASYALVLTVDDATLPGDGFSSTTVRAKIINFFGEPSPILTMIDFSISPENVGVLSATSVPTDDNGEAAVVFTSTLVADPVSVLITAEATISVNCGVASLSVPVTDIASIGLTPQEIGSIVVTAEPTTIYTDGSDAEDAELPNTSTITAVVNDINGFPLIQNTLVKFTSFERDTEDPIGIIEAFALTDENGVATVPLKAGFLGGIAVVTATDSSGTISGDTLVIIKSSLTIVTESLGETSTEFTFYEAFVSASGGVPPYTWSISPESVNKPEEIEFEFGQVEEFGSFSGNPQDAGFIGTIAFAIVVEDSIGNRATKILDFTITEPAEEETP